MMIKKFPVNKKLKEKLTYSYPHAMDEVDIGVVLNTLLSQLPQPKETDKDQVIHEYTRIVANTAIFYLRSLQNLFRGME